MGVCASARRSHFTKTFVSESMASAPSTGVLSGNAAWNAGGFLRLNPASSSTGGSITYAANLPSVFSARADMAVSNVSGADAMWFFFGCTSVPPFEVSAVGGYIIERNENQTLVRLRYNGTSLATAAWSKDTSFDTLKIDYNHGKFTITYKGSVILTYTDPTPRTLPGNLFGWGARSGGTVNDHDVKNLSVVGSYNA